MAYRRSLALLGTAVLTLALVAGGVALADMASNDDTPATVTDGATPERTIEVSGSGEVSVQPDLGVIHVGVEAIDDDAEVAQSQVAENVSAVRAALTDLGIAEDQIRTTGYNLYRYVDREHRDGPERTQYRVVHSLTVEVSETDRVGEVLDAAVASGATHVSGVQFRLAESTREELRLDALDAAMGDARSQADRIADSGDLTITGIGSVSTNDVSYPRFPVEYARDDLADAGTEIDVAPVSVTATVRVTYVATSN